ncbi:hypothetical protein L1887_47347 [Cichorium endivia]|nr:hypothetical protein L1887_47347 [Cichorium endivia]
MAERFAGGAGIAGSHLIAGHIPAGAVLVHAPDRNGSFATELAASVMLHLRLAVLDGYHFALAAIGTLVKVFPDLARLHLDAFLRDVLSGSFHARLPLTSRLLVAEVGGDHLGRGFSSLKALDVLTIGIIRGSSMSS